MPEEIRHSCREDHEGQAPGVQMVAMKLRPFHEISGDRGRGRRPGVKIARDVSSNADPREVFDLL